MNDKSKHALSLVTPQARHHFTRFDQVDQLVGASESDADVGFMARLMMLCCLPRTDPGNQKEYKRVNGPYTLIMLSSSKTKLPFGNIPRLLLAWVCTEAVRTQSRVLVLGESLSEFMRRMGIYNTGGAVRKRLQNQMKRLFNANIRLIYEDEHSERFIASNIADRGEFWWNLRKPDARMLFDSKIELGEKFFEEIISHPVPLDMNTLKALKRCALGLDLYLWLVYRTFGLTRPLGLSWTSLYHQFDGDPAKAGDHDTVQNFRRKVLRELKKIKSAWPELNYSTSRGVLILHPSKPAIPPHQQFQVVK